MQAGHDIYSCLISAFVIFPHPLPIAVRIIIWKNVTYLASFPPFSFLSLCFVFFILFQVQKKIIYNYIFFLILWQFDVLNRIIFISMKKKNLKYLYICTTELSVSIYLSIYLFLSIYLRYLRTITAKPPWWAPSLTWHRTLWDQTTSTFCNQ